MKKFFCLVIVCVFAVFSVASLCGCSKDELEKVSKNLNVYTIDTVFDDESKTLSGSEKILYRNESGAPLKNLCLHLYPRAFREGASVLPYTVLNSATCFPNGTSYGDIEIESVKVNGNSGAFELAGTDEDILTIEFGFVLGVKKTVEIAINFVLKIPNCTHRLGFYESNVNLGNWYPIVCEIDDGKFDTTPYYSTGDPFYSGIANYIVSIAYPKSYNLCSTGKIETSQNGDLKTSKIVANAVRDFAMCLSNDSKIVSTWSGKTQICYMGYTNDSSHQKFLEISKKAVDYFGETFGAYPYSTLCVVKTPFIYGGMEYPNIVYVSDSIDEEKEFEKVIVHEIAHQWWYGVVGNNETKEAWLDESLAEYSTALFFEHNGEYGVSYEEFVSTALSSYLLYVDVIKTIKGTVSTKMNLAVFEYQNDYEYSYMIYVKGVIMFDTLRSMVGEKKLIAGLKKYYENNKFKIAHTSDLISAFKTACHRDVDGFFRGYLDGTTVISVIN